MSVLAALTPVKAWLGFDKPNASSIVISLTTKLTVAFILIASIMVSLSTFFGDPIDCMVEEVPEGNIYIISLSRYFGRRLLYVTDLR